MWTRHKETICLIDGRIKKGEAAMKYTVACCFLTHNHKDVIEDVLDKCLEKYLEHGFDVCICDDSDDSETEMMIRQRIKKGYVNLFYVDMQSAINGDDKLLRVIKGDCLPKEYDYVWPCKDRVCFAEEYLDRLCYMIDQGYDIIQGIQDDNRAYVKRDTYSDPVEFYRDYAFCTTNWEATIQRRSTMLFSIEDEKKIENIGVDAANSFNQMLSVFWGLYYKENPVVGVCPYMHGERYISQVGTGSSWKKKDTMYSLWIDKWVAANYNLPDIYNPYKAAAIKKETNQMELFGSLEWMIYYRENGLFDYDVFKKYKDMWAYLTDIPLQWLELVAMGEYKAVKEMAFMEFENTFKEEEYYQGYCLFSTNSWFSQIYNEKDYRILTRCFVKYKDDILATGGSHVFDGVRSVEDLLEQYRD